MPISLQSDAENRFLELMRCGELLDGASCMFQMRYWSIFAVYPNVIRKSNMLVVFCQLLVLQSGSVFLLFALFWYCVEFFSRCLQCLQLLRLMAHSRSSGCNQPFQGRAKTKNNCASAQNKQWMRRPRKERVSLLLSLHGRGQATCLCPQQRG